LKLAFSLTLRNDTQAQNLLADLRASGFQGVEPTFGLEGTLPTAADPRKSAEQIRRMADDAGLKIPSMRGGPGFWATFASDDAARRQAAVELASKACEAVKIMGGDMLLVVPGQWEAHQTYSSVWKNALDTARRLADVAEKSGITVALENVSNQFLLSPREWMQFLDDVGSPRVRMYFDVGNAIFLRAGYPERWIRELGRKYIARIHFKDALHGGPQMYLLEGAVNWPAVRAAMREIGYEDWVGLELNLPNHHPRAMFASQYRAAEGILKGEIA
jgi:L-ribulose-5-phosphate 3-epimerase